MQIGEDLCGHGGEEECYLWNSDCFGKITSLINAFSQFDTVELSNIRHCWRREHGNVCYITTLSVLNSNRLRVSFQMGSDDFISECREWLNYKAPDWSQPPRELYLDAQLDLEGVKALLQDLISVGFSYHYHTWSWSSAVSRNPIWGGQHFPKSTEIEFHQNEFHFKELNTKINCLKSPTPTPSIFPVGVGEGFDMGASNSY